MRRTVLAWALACLPPAIGCGTIPGLPAPPAWLAPAPSEPDLPALREASDAGLPAPLGLRATSGELREIPLRWEPLLDDRVAGYVLERGEEREGPFQRIAAVPGRMRTVYVDHGPLTLPGVEARGEPLPDGQTWFYRVRAFTADGAIAQASEVVAATTAPPADPPPGLRAWSHRPREVPLTWQPPSGAHVAGYRVERSPTRDGRYEEVARIDDPWQTTWVDEGLGDLRVFHYRVRAVNRAGGLGEPSEPVQAVTKPEPLPPLGLRLVERRLGVNTLAWEPNVESDLAGYRLLRRRAQAEREETVAELPPDATSAVDTAVGAGDEVAYRLVALDGDGLESAPSEPVTVQSERYELAAETGSEGVALSWTVHESYRGAHVYLAGPLSRSEIAFVRGDRFVHREAQPGRSYRYVVVLEREDGSLAPPSEPLRVDVPEAS